MPDHASQHDIMTLNEIAEYLKVSEKTILRMLQNGEIPGAKVSNQWRFVRAIVDDWLTHRMYAAPRDSLVSVVETALPIIPLTRLVSEPRIVMNVRPGTINEIIQQLVQPLRTAQLVPNPDDFAQQLQDREDVVSTAIAQGLAIPHVRSPDKVPVTSPFIVLGVCPEGTDYNALDGNKTTVFAMPVAGSEAMHLRLLARISLLFRREGIREKMTQAAASQAIMEILAIADHDLAAQTR